MNQCENQIDFLLILLFFWEIFALWSPRAVTNRMRSRNWRRISDGNSARRNTDLFPGHFHSLAAHEGRGEKNQNAKIGLCGNLQVADSIFPLKQLENKPHCPSMDYMEKDFGEHSE